MTRQRPDFFDALAQPIRNEIRSGKLAVGDLLPSEAELARKAGTKRYSVRKALGLLRDEGLVKAVPGRGWAVVGASRTSAGRPVLPRYREIAAELREAIEGGEVTAGSLLPSEAELRERFGVSRSTVRQALAVLERDGLVRTRPGKGRYVLGG